MTDTTMQPRMTLEDLLIRCTNYEDISLDMDAREFNMLKQHISLLKEERQLAEKARETLGLDVAWQQRALVAEIAAKSYKNIAEAGTKELAALKGSVGEAKDWEIDHSTDVPILVYKKCSVIESEQAYGLLNLIKQSAMKGEQVPVSDKRDMKIVTQAECLAWAYKFVGECKATELSTAPQKPVVLPKSFVMAKLGPNVPEIKCYSEQSVIAAIEASGGTVKRK